MNEELKLRGRKQAALENKCLIALKLLAKNDNIWSPAGAFSLLRRLRCLNSSAQTVELTSIAAEGEPLYFTKKKLSNFFNAS